MTCSEFEILLADFLDGTLPGEQMDSFERHRASCLGCAELASDAGSAVAFIGHVPEVVPPTALVRQIVVATSGSNRSFGQSFGHWFGEWTRVVLHPQFAMGVAMVILSLAIAARFWSGATDGVQRAWERTVKGYESMQLVYDAQSQLQEWLNDRPGGRDGDNQ